MTLRINKKGSRQRVNTIGHGSIGVRIIVHRERVALFLNEWTDTVGLIGFVIVIIGVIGEVMVVSKESKEVTAQ